MPSIDDVFNQLVAANKTLNQVDSGIHQLVTIQSATQQAVGEIVKQGEIIICVLENISEHTCGIWNETHSASLLQGSIERSAAELLDILKCAYPAAALETQRLAALQEKIEKCCPPPEPTPVCTYTACSEPPPAIVTERGK